MLNRHSTFLESVRVALAFATGIAVILAIVSLTGGEIISLLRDPAVTARTDIFDGFFSQAGVALMVMTALHAAIAAFHANRGRAALIGLAIWATIFATDDFFLLHEQLGPLQPALMAGYGFTLAILSVALARSHDRAIVMPVVVTFLAFGASGCADILTDMWHFNAEQPFGLTTFKLLAVSEDLAKLGGIATLFAFSVGVAQESRSASRTGAIRDQ